MHEIKIGQAHYVQSGFQLYNHSDAVVDAASKAEWAEGVLSENNVWLSPEHLQADVATNLLELAKSTLAQAEEILNANLYGPVLVRPERPLNPAAEEAPAEQVESVLFQFVESGSLAGLTPLRNRAVQALRLVA